MIEVKQLKLPNYVQGLWRAGVFLSFAADYVPRNNIKAPIIITDKIYKDFEKFLLEYEINYSLPGEKDLARLKASIKSNDDSRKDKFNLLEKIFFWKKIDDKTSSLTRKIDRYYYKKRVNQYWDQENVKWIKNGLLREMSLVANGEKEKIKVSLYEDNVYNEAKNILLDLNRSYTTLLMRMQKIA